MLNRLFGDEAEVLGDRDYQLLLLTAAVVPLGNGIISPIINSLTVVYGVSTAQIGWVMAAMTAPGIAFIPLMGSLADRYGRKTILITSTVIFGVSGLLIPFTTDFETVIGLRLVQGIGFSGIAPMLITAIGDMYTGSEESTAQGLRLSTVGVSQVLFPVVAGTLVLVSWKFPFALYAIALPISALLLVGFHEPTAIREPISEENSPDGSTLRDLYHLVIHRQVMATLVARSLPTFIFLGFLTYVSIIVIRLLGGTPKGAGLFVAISGLTVAVAASQAGRITNFFGSRYHPLIGAQVCLMVGFPLLAFAESMIAAAIGVTIGSFGIGLTGSLYRSIITGFASEELRGGLVSIGESFGRISATIAPPLIGGAISFTTPIVGFDLAVRWTILVVSLVLGLIGVVCLVTARRTSAPVHPDRSSFKS